MLCNPGAERALKAEVAAVGLGWRPGYQRRGFVTFKADEMGVDGLRGVELAIARRLCLSLGRSASREEAEAKVAGVDVLHQARFFERRMAGVASDSQPVAGDWVGTVVELGEGEFWSGLHRHAPGCSPDPAGDGGVVMLEESPSRAWLKLEEAVRFFGLEFSTKDIVVELGCAPGGVVLALLNRGVSVIGVDPAGMAEVVTRHGIVRREDAPANRPWFYHCRKPAALASKRDLGQGVSWFMSDMNQSPEVVLKECARFCRMSPGIRRVLITLKLTDLMQVLEKERWFAALREMGFERVRLQQLSVHHRELVIFGE